MSLSGSCLTLFALFALTWTAPAAANTLVDNVNGITLDEAGHIVRFSGLVMGNDGKVVRLVTAPAPVPDQDRKARKGQEPVAPDRVDYRIDGKGKTMLPGLIDAHGHVMKLGFQALTLDLSDTRSLAEAQAKIATYVRDHGNRRWIIGRGWNQERWGLGRFPTAAELDAVVADKPVWLERVDSHAGWANSAAMAEAGITVRSVAPPGGRIEMAGGKPIGIFVDAMNSNGLETRVYCEEELVVIPAGPFIRGTSQGGFDEQPERRIYLDEFSIDSPGVAALRLRGRCHSSRKDHSSPESPSGYTDSTVSRGSSTGPRRSCTVSASSTAA